MGRTIDVQDISAFSGLVEIISDYDFRDQVWQSKWLHKSATLSPTELAKIVDLVELDRVIFSGALAAPDLQILQNGKAVDAPKTTSISPTTDTRVLYEAFQRGASFRIQHLDNYLPSVRHVCGLIEAEMGFHVRANAYLSPRNSQGLAPHYDSSEAFIVQIAGEKTWQVFDRYTEQVELPLYEARFDARRHRPIGQPERVTLRRGDLLYMPRGVMHAATTGPSISIHVTFAVLGLTWVDLLSSALRQMAGTTPELRKIVPFGASRRDTDEEVARHGARLLQDPALGAALTPFMKDLAARYEAQKPAQNFGAFAELWRDA